MPPPHLHPRSRMTSSLFATTVLASFFVVALPHVLPCPAPRVKFADGRAPGPVCDDGDDVAGAAPTRRRRRRRLPAEGEEVAALTEKTATDAAAATTTPATATDGFCPRRPAVATEVQRGDGGIARFAMTDNVDSDGGRTGRVTAAVAAQTAASRPARECPVPKPGGLVGELLGFKTSSSSSSSSSRAAASTTERPS